MFRKSLCVFLLALSVLACAFAARAESASHELVHAYFSAYNAHNVGEMRTMVTDDVRWMSVEGDRIAVEANGKKSLGEAMAAHFARSPSTRSEVRDINELGKFVTVIEAAMRESDGATGSQCAISVYQISAGLISNVWYYAALPCAPAAESHNGIDDLPQDD